MKTIAVFLSGLLASLTGLGQTPDYQSKIDQAFAASFARKSNQVTAIINELKKEEQQNAYWLAYAYMRSGTYFMVQKYQDKQIADINNALSLLERQEKQDSETKALTGHLIAFSITFNPDEARKLSAKAKAFYKQALKLNPNNPRAVLGLGLNDYYKPKQYGGGTKVEELLLKSIQLLDSSDSSGPTWGMDQAYFILSSFYLREGERDKAKMYCIQGLSKFPNDIRLNQLKASL